MNKVERLKAKVRSMRQDGERIAKNTLHSAETLVVGSAGAYAEGRLSDDNGEWGFRSVPYLYMGGAALFITGLFAGDRYSADLFAAGTGAVGGHLFRTMYETGQEAKTNTTGRRQMKTKVPMGLADSMKPGNNQRQPAPAPARQRQPYGTALDGLGV